MGGGSSDGNIGFSDGTSFNPNGLVSRDRQRPVKKLKRMQEYPIVKYPISDAVFRGFYVGETKDGLAIFKDAENPDAYISARRSFLVENLDGSITHGDHASFGVYRADKSKISPERLQEFEKLERKAQTAYGWRMLAPSIAGGLAMAAGMLYLISSSLVGITCYDEVAGGRSTPQEIERKIANSSVLERKIMRLLYPARKLAYELVEDKK